MQPKFLCLSHCYLYSSLFGIFVVQTYIARCAGYALLCSVQPLEETTLPLILKLGCDATAGPELTTFLRKPVAMDSAYTQSFNAGWRV